MDKSVSSFNELFKTTINLSKKHGARTLAVVCAEDHDLLEALHELKQKGIIEGILIGNKERIVTYCSKENIPPDEFEIVEETDPRRAAEKAVAMVREGKADFLMKGHLPTSMMMKAVVDRTKGLRENHLLSHVTVLEPPHYYKLLLMSDSGVNINPDVEEKVEIAKNAIEVAHYLGVKKPNVAIVAAVEVINPKIPATVEAAEVAEIFKQQKYRGAVVEGPLALDDAIAEHAVEVKGLKGKVPGHADVVVLDNIEAGNAVYKALVYFSSTKHAGIVYGAKVPIVLDSRAGDRYIRFYSIVLGAYIMHRQKKAGK